MLVLQQLYNISDESLTYQVNDRCSEFALNGDNTGDGLWADSAYRIYFRLAITQQLTIPLYRFLPGKQPPNLLLLPSDNAIAACSMNLPSSTVSQLLSFVSQSGTKGTIES